MRIVRTRIAEAAEHDGLDQQIAQRIRDLLAQEPAVTEQRMFGGLAFLIDGRGAVTLSHRAGLMISASDLRTKRELARWVGAAVRYARLLPTSN